MAWVRIDRYTPVTRLRKASQPKRKASTPGTSTTSASWAGSEWAKDQMLVVQFQNTEGTIEFTPAAGFHRTQIEEPKNLALLRDALYEVTGRRLQVETVTGASPEPFEQEDPRELSEEDVISLLKDTFDAEEVEDH